MKYANGTDIMLGDRVIIDGKYRGIVVADIDGGTYSESNPRAQWRYLGSGVMIDTDFGGLIHYRQEDMDNESIELEPRSIG